MQPCSRRRGARRRALLLLALLAAGGCGSTDGEPVAPETMPVLATAFTNRLSARDPVMQAIELTQTVYASTREENGPGAIILAPQDPAVAMVAMNRVTHMPVNAPLLYLDRNGRLPAATKREMKRLRPDGVVQDGQVQVYLVGWADASVAREVERDLGYKVRTLFARNPVELAEVVDRWQAALKSDHPDEIVVSALSPEGISNGIGPMGFNAHMGKGFAWVYRDSVPAATRRILERRIRRSYIYLTGPESVISADVERELSRYGPVRRIQGPNVYATAATNAGYRDFGRNYGWWWGAASRSWGWGIAQAGHNFIIGTPDDLLGIIPGALLGHMGKHGPILLVTRDSVPSATADYLKMVRPSAVSPNETILNFAWIIGDTSVVSWRVQQELTRLLAPTAPRGPALPPPSPLAAMPEAPRAVQP